MNRLLNNNQKIKLLRIILLEEKKTKKIVEFLNPNPLLSEANPRIQIKMKRVHKVRMLKRAHGSTANFSLIIIIDKIGVESLRPSYSCSMKFFSVISTRNLKLN